MSREEQKPAETIALNGVYYAEVPNRGELWRVGSLEADWQARLALFPSAPNEEKLAQLEKEGIFPCRAKRPGRLAVMCAGLGAAWPGMGRELYDNFPAARDAMDELASLADWNLLGLMDEKDSAVINSSRCQIPYLFLLEYAQWRQLRWLGLAPDLICGHSLGELVALCLAGVYPVEGAWLLLDTRAKHMAALERKGAGETGMLAISADRAKIDEVLRKWPDLAISNANAPRQFVLGGPRPELMEARRELRRSRIPAFMLPINLAFHNPAMRILRDLSTRRLNTLEMRPPAIPMLSCVTADLYPSEQTQISRAIADLDENTVDWMASIHAMRKRFQIETFLELGPQDILCGLVRENEPAASCIPADLKDREALAMRSACARLFACGHLPIKRLAALHAPAEKFRSPQPSANEGETGWAAFDDIPEKELEIILDLLARAGKRSRAELSPQMDLKYDLGLRSSNFPLLLQEAEKSLGKSPDLENIFNISTVGELALFLAGKKPGHEARESGQIRQNSIFRPPLSIWSWQGSENFGNLQINPASKGPLRLHEGPVLLLCEDSRQLDNLWEGLGRRGQVFGVPAWQAEELPALEKSGAVIEPLPIARGTLPGPEALEEFRKRHGPVAGLFLCLPDRAYGGNSGMEDPLPEKLAALQKLSGASWFCILRILTDSENRGEARQAAAAFFEKMEKIFPDAKGLRLLCWNDARNGGFFQNRNETGDLLALSLLYGTVSCEFWDGSQKAQDALFCLSPDGPFFHEPQAEELPRSSAWQAGLQYSLFARPLLESHGAGKKPWSGKSEELACATGAAWLPVGAIASTLLYAGHQPLPWLLPASLQDFNLENLPLLPHGISRECRLTVLERPWLIQNGHYVRLARLGMACRELFPNGRASANWKGAANGIGAYGHAPPAPGPIWTPLEIRAPIPQEKLDAFYRAVNFGPSWRCIESAGLCGEKNGLLLCRLKKCEMPHAIAPGQDWGYSVFLWLVESLAQAAFFSLSETLANGDGEGFGQINDWALLTIGYLQFDWTALAKGGSFILEMRLAWREAAMLRYDAQILAENGAICLVMTHLELEKRQSGAPEGQKGGDKAAAQQ